VVAPPKVHKAAVELRLCTVAGTLEERVVPRRDPGYKRAKKLVWGDGLE